MLQAGGAAMALVGLLVLLAEVLFLLGDAPALGGDGAILRRDLSHFLERVNEPGARNSPARLPHQNDRRSITAWAPTIGHRSSSFK